MKNNLVFILFLGLSIVFTPGFQCGDTFPKNCDLYKTDTIKNNLEFINFRPDYRVNDTLKFTSLLNDTAHSTSGVSFVSQYPYNNRNLYIQTYKVVMNNGTPALNYANIEFNPLITEGSFSNSNTSGYYFQYKKLDPYYRLGVSLISGYTGLYLITFSTGGYSYVNTNTPCTNYRNLYFIPEQIQQKQYWDSLGVIKLQLNGGADYTIKNKEDPDYLFIRIKP